MVPASPFITLLLLSFSLFLLCQPSECHPQLATRSNDVAIRSDRWKRKEKCVNPADGKTPEACSEGGMELECTNAAGAVVPCDSGTPTWSTPPSSSSSSQNNGYDCTFGDHCIVASYASMLDPNEATSCSNDGLVCGYARGSQSSVRCGDGSAATVFWNAYDGGRYYNKIQAIVPGDIAGAFYSTGLTAQISYETYDSAMIVCNNE